MTAPLPVIAIDGPAASGKSTLARRLAAHFGFTHLNTGLLYRAVAFQLFRAGHSEADVEAAVTIAQALTPADLDDPALASNENGSNASKIAKIMPVREALIAYQRQFCGAPPGGRGAVLDGRDITTFIWPQAEARLFCTASPAERAHRRLKELQSLGDSVTHEAILADLSARDARDAANTPYTLKIAPGAYVLDTTHLDIASAVAAAVQFVSPRIGL